MVRVELLRLGEVELGGSDLLLVGFEVHLVLVEGAFLAGLDGHQDEAGLGVAASAEATVPRE